jgi:hypothetical protein
MAIAILNSEGRVITFVRDDVPSGWQPPEGTTAVPDTELPEGWGRVEEPDPVPSQVSARQIRLWLVQAGVSMATVEAAIDSIEDAVIRESVRVEWEYAPHVERTHAWLVPMAAALGFTEQQIDQAFREASQL